MDIYNQTETFYQIDAKSFDEILKLQQVTEVIYPPVEAPFQFNQDFTRFTFFDNGVVMTFFKDCLNDDGTINETKFDELLVLEKLK